MSLDVHELDRERLEPDPLSRQASEKSLDVWRAEVAAAEVERPQVRVECEKGDDDWDG